MVTGLRVSAGLALTGALFSGLGQTLTGAAPEPVALIGGSALTRVAASEFPERQKLVWQVAARAEEGLHTPGPVSGARVLSPPSVSRVEVDADGTVRFQGRGTPGTRVTLNRQGNAIGSTLVSSGGDWELTLANAVSAGEHRFGAEASLNGNGDGTRIAGADVRIAIPRDYLTAAATGAEGGDRRDSARRRAEELARDASERFSEITRERLAQAQPSQQPGSTSANSDAKAPPGEPAPEGGILFRLQDWLARANRDFQGEIVRRLQTPSPPEGLPGEVAKPMDAAGSAAAAKARAEAEAHARAERIAQERKAAELRRQEEERRAAAAADARDREAARQAEAQKNAEVPARRAAEAERQPTPQAGPDRAAEEATRGRAEADAAERERAAREKAAAEDAARQRAAQADAARRRATAAEAERLRKMAEDSADEALRAARAKQERDARERALLEAEVAEKARRAEERARKRIAEERSRIARKAERGDQLKTITRDTVTIGKDVPAATKPAAEPPAPVRRAAPAPSTTPPASRPVARSADPASAPPATPRDTVAQAPPRARLRGGDGTGDDPASAARDAQRDAQWDARERAAPRRDAARPDGAMSLGQRAPASRSSEAPAAVAGHRRRATSAECRYAGRRVKPPATYVVRRGDSLWRISARHYRRGYHWPVIYRANDAKIDDPDLIFPCQRFFLPSLRRR